MNEVFSGDRAELNIHYEVDGDYVIPTSAYANVRGHTGNTILSNVTLAVDKTTTQLSIDGADNTLADPASPLENRYVTVYFIYNNGQYQVDYHYRVKQFVPMTATADDVRNELGLDRSELGDNQIGIYDAYLQLANDYGTTFTDALIATDYKNSLANRAIAVRAAIEVTMSLSMRAGIRMTSEDQTFQRMAQFDPVAIRLNLGRLLGTLISQILDEDETGTAVLTVATPDDLFSGAT